MNEVRTNPDFLKFLEEQEKKALEQRDIGELYQVLDTLLVLDLDEEKIHKVYQEILKIAFSNIEKRLEENKKLSLEEKDIFYIRSFYEHGIEKWSMENYDGAKELFYILSHIVEDQILQESMAIHMIACGKKEDIDTFYQKVDVDTTLEKENEKYGYFITQFLFNKEQFLNQNGEYVQQLHKELQHLITL